MDFPRLRSELPNKFNEICHEVRINDAIIDWIDIVFEQIGNASKCPPHSHTWFEFNYLFVGEMKTRFGNQLVTISEGDFFLIPPGLVHSHLYRSGQPHEGICIRWRLRQAVDAASAQKDSLFERLYGLGQWKAGGYRDIYGIKDILLHFFTQADFDAPPLSNQLLLVGLLEALTRVSRAETSDRIEAPEFRDPLVRKVEIYLEDYQGEHFNVGELAASLHMSYGHLCRLYKQRTGMTLIERMNRIRLDKARKLLLNDASMLVKEAAMLAGFPDIYYFSKVFKKYYGLSPAVFRKQAEM